jgi:large subunit ribosomal protein L46
MVSSFSTKSKKKGAPVVVTEGYLAQKQAAKEKRRQQYETKVVRTENLQTRRADAPRDQKKGVFRSWFIKKKVDEEYMSRKARQAGLEWKLDVAVIVERLNVVLPDMETWETEYGDLKAHMSQYGKQYPKALYNVDVEQIVTTQEDLDAMLPKGYTPAPRVTTADETGDVRTTNRKLKTNIVLAVQDTGHGDEVQWQLPTVALKEDETLLEAAKRAVKEKVGEEVEFWCPSNAPYAVDMVAFPKDQRKDGFYGTKTFFIKVQYDCGDVLEKTMTVKDFAWVDRGEMVERVQQERGDYESKFYHYML